MYCAIHSCVHERLRHRLYIYCVCKQLIYSRARLSRTLISRILRELEIQIRSVGSSFDVNSFRITRILKYFTTEVVSSNPVHGEVYSIQHYVMKFVGVLWQDGGFLRVLGFPPRMKLIATI